MSDAVADLQRLDGWRRRVLSAVPSLDPIELSLLDAHGGVVVEDLTAARPVPAHATSTADGFALRAPDAAEGTTLGIAGEARVGRPTRARVHAGQAVRIAAGAVLPEGADTVVSRDHADDRGDHLVVSGSGARPGDHVRPAGQEIRAGAQLVAAGSRLSPGHLGLLAAAGHARVRVHPQPRVSVLTAGDGIVDPAAPVRPGEAPDVNGVVLNAMARAAGAHAMRHRAVRRDPATLRDAVEDMLGQADLLVVTGADEPGVLDDAVGAVGDVEHGCVAMEPGTQQAFGLVEPEADRWVPVFGLPAQPVAAAVSFEVFVHAAIRRLQGRSDLNRPRVVARLSAPLAGRPDRVVFTRVSLRRDGAEWVATPAESRGVQAIAPLAATDGLAEVPAGVWRMEPGEQVLTHLLATPDG